MRPRPRIQLPESPLPWRRGGDWLSVWLVLALGILHPLLASAAEAEKTPADYARDLGSPDRALKREAAYQLSRMGKDARIALPQLIAALEEDQQQVWFGAITALANLGPDAEPALPALLKELEAWQPFRKDRQGAQALYRTAVALGSIGAPAVPALSNALAHDKWFVRAGAARALGFAPEAAGPVLPRLISTLTDERVEVREAAAETLAILGPSSVGLLTETVRSGETARARVAAATALGRLGSRALEAAPVLELAMAADKETAVRVEAVEALARVWQGRAELVPVLLRAWDTSNPEVQAAARSALLLVRPVETALLPALVTRIESDDAHVRSLAAGVLADLGPDARAAVDPLVRALKQRGIGDDVEVALSRALAAVGEPALGPIFASLASQPPESLATNDWTLATLRRMDATALPGLAAALTNESPAVRLGALESLVALGRDGRPVARKLPRLLEDPEPGVRSRAWLAAAACGTPPETLLTKLDAGLNDRSIEVRRAAIQSVGRLGRGARPAVPRLVTEIDAADAGLRVAAVRALAALGPEAEAAAPSLAEHLANGDPSLQVELLAALGSIGVAAAPQSSKMIPAGTSTHTAVRLAFFEATARVKPSGGEVLALIQGAVGDAEPGVRAAAIAAMVSVDAASDGTVTTVLAALEDPNDIVRHAAVAGIASMGERGRPAEEKLFALLERDSDRSGIRDALRAIHPTSVPSLLLALGHADWTIREMAADSLARLGKLAGDAVPALEKAMRDDAYEEVKRASRRALRRIRES